MPLHTLTAPCWTFTCRREETFTARWREHAPTATALDTHAGALAGGCRPYQLDSACIEVVCDCCSLPLGRTGAAYDPRHFPALDICAEQLADVLASAGWTTDGHGVWHCEDCPPWHCLPARHLPDHRPADHPSAA